MCCAARTFNFLFKSKGSSSFEESQQQTKKKTSPTKKFLNNHKVLNNTYTFVFFFGVFTNAEYERLLRK